MSMTLEQVYTEAIDLPLDQQDQLVEKLMCNRSEHLDPAIMEAHSKEAASRREAYKRGEIEASPLDEALARMKKLAYR